MTATIPQLQSALNVLGCFNEKKNLLHMSPSSPLNCAEYRFVDNGHQPAAALANGM
jgi:hypothetical protein